MIFGVAVPYNKVTDSNYQRIVPYVFDSVTCENEMKPNYIRTNAEARIDNYNSNNSYDYRQSDTIVEFAKDHSMKVVGHTLWYDPSNVPKFVIDLSNNGSLNASNMSNIVRDHITNVITHFNSSAPNTVYSWQVTNKALDASGNVKPNQIVHRILGDSSFSNLYRYAQNVITPPAAARAPAPGPAPPPAPARINGNTKLFYNDNQDLAPSGIFTRLNTLKSIGILDGVGIQCHGTASSNLDLMTLKYVQAGFEVHFTEVDNVSLAANDTLLTTWYREVISIALKYGVRNFTVWGLIGSPLLFNPTSYQPKNCYNALIQEIKNFGRQEYDIFIIIGQSNSVGRGATEYTFENAVGGIYDMKNSSNIVNFSDDFDNKFDERIRTFTIDNCIVPAFEQLDNGGGVGVRGIYGFGLSFARQYIKENKLATGRKILLINRGFGGTGFFSGSTRWNHYLDNNLYDKAINSIKMAKSAIGSGSVVKAILWHQGENDVSFIFDQTVRTPLTSNFDAIRTGLGLHPKRSTYTEDEVKDLYSSSLTTMLNLLRDKIAAPTTPILLGGLCPSMYIDHNISAYEKSSTKKKYPYDKFPYTNYPLMNQLILSIARNNGYKFVSAEPISSVSPYFNHYLKSNNNGDIVHFNKSSLIEFGKRYFYIYNDSITLNSATFNNDEYDVFVILGQSNSVGRGVTDYEFDNATGGIYNMREHDFYNNDFNKIEDNKIKCFNERKFSYPQIINGTEPIEALGGTNNPNEYGFGMSFARQYIKENPTKKVLLINCGWGGTSIDNWAINSGTKIQDIDDNLALYFSNHTYEGKNLYQASLARIRSALSQISSKSTVKAILWHQGESNIGSVFGGASTILNDPDVQNNSRIYENKLTTVLNSLRSAIASSTTPILLGGLSPSHYVNHRTSASRYSGGADINPGNKYRKMSELISTIASNNGYKFVSAGPITDKSPHFNHYLKGNDGDITHFSKSSQIELGRRYFYVYNDNRISF
jgi:endo-1,4-beta-xylanase